MRNTRTTFLLAALTLALAACGGDPHGIPHDPDYELTPEDIANYRAMQDEAAEWEATIRETMDKVAADLANLRGPNGTALARARGKTLEEAIAQQASYLRQAEEDLLGPSPDAGAAGSLSGGISAYEACPGVPQWEGPFRIKILDNSHWDGDMEMNILTVSARLMHYTTIGAKHQILDPYVSVMGDVDRTSQGPGKRWTSYHCVPHSGVARNHLIIPYLLPLRLCPYAGANHYG